MKTAYIHSDDFARYNLGPRHPLQQTRLVDIWNRLHKEQALGATLFLVEPNACTEDAIRSVHSHDYIDLLKLASSGMPNLPLSRYGLGPGDTPAFTGMWENGLLYCGGSDCGANLLADNSFSRAICFAGGLHHAHYDHASGFCILSDIAIAINTLKSRGFRRVMYVDIDVHHGDGVEALFRNDPDVLTVSFHESGAWLFPGTGNVQDRGGDGAEDSVWNVPFAPSTGGDIWCEAILTITKQLHQRFRPDAIVLQVGADALEDDPLGHLSITRWEWLNTVDGLLKIFASTPTLILGGGGYNRDAVVDVWTRVAMCSAGLPWSDTVSKHTSSSTADALMFHNKTMAYLKSSRNI